jgi:hypothetical protein
VVKVRLKELEEYVVENGGVEKVQELDGLKGKGKRKTRR